MAWQYWSSYKIYPLVVLATLPLMLRYRLITHHLALANPTFPYGGIAIGKKSECIQKFQKAPQFLRQTTISASDPYEKRVAKAKAFKPKFPLVAKPECGFVGRGVRVVHSFKELSCLLKILPEDYMLQEYCDHPLEYGIFFCKMPGERKGKVISLTKKIIPQVMGDGKSTVRQLLENNAAYRHSREAIFRNGTPVDSIPKKGETVRVTELGSHTYGSIFVNAEEEITPELESWINKLCSYEKEFFIGRFDMKVPSKEALQTGENTKIVEVNGSFSEPIHMYDDKHSLWYGITQFFKTYNLAYKISRKNKNRLKQSVPFIEMTKKYIQLARIQSTLHALTHIDLCNNVIFLEQEPKVFLQTLLNLKAGTYVFLVKNRNVKKTIGFLLRKQRKKVKSFGGLKFGAVKAIKVTLEPGEYTFSCPLNETPDYPLKVK